MREGVFKQITASKSKTFLAFCFCFLFGIALGSFVYQYTQVWFVYMGILLCISCMVTWWNTTQARLFFACVAILLFGILRVAIAFPPERDSRIDAREGEQSTIRGYVSQEPDIRQDGVRYIFKSADEHIKGNLYLRLGLYPRFGYGDKLSVTCIIEKPRPIETQEGLTFRYDMYLARLGVSAICGSPQVEKIGVGEGNSLIHGIFSIKNVVADRVNLLWHEPYAGFMAGLLYGSRGGLGSLNELFAKTGTTHIVAISGYNITIIATILMTLCVHMLIARKKAFWLVVCGIIVFVIFAGASASVVRAGVMGIIVLIAKQLGRGSRAGSVIAFSAVLMALHNPLVLVWDTGFQLSFLSTVGLVYVNPILERRAEKIPNLHGMKEAMLSTVSATLITLPLVLFQFGRLSTVAIIVNVLILWSIPFIMALGFASVLFSFLFFPLGQIVSWIAWAGMTYIVSVVSWFASVSAAGVNVRVSFWVLVGMYGVLGIWIWKRHALYRHI